MGAFSRRGDVDYLWKNRVLSTGIWITSMISSCGDEIGTAHPRQSSADMRICGKACGEKALYSA
jgi:hypothetical protein